MYPCIETHYVFPCLLSLLYQRGLWVNIDVRREVGDGADVVVVTACLHSLACPVSRQRDVQPQQALDTRCRPHCNFRSR